MKWFLSLFLILLAGCETGYQSSYIISDVTEESSVEPETR